MNYELIKVCGMRDPENILAVDGLPVDWIGLIFYPHSNRYVAAPPAYLPTNAKRVGVFVDADPADVRQHIADYRLDLIQLHGHESPEYVKSLHGQAKIIKAISVMTRADIALTEPYAGLVDYFLFDTRALPAAAVPAASPAGSSPVPAASPADSAPVPAASGSPAGPVLPGGTGAHFDWSILDAYNGETPFLLSGGIGPDDAARVIAFHHPRCAGLDLNSRFETAPALKDIAALSSFLSQIPHIPHKKKTP